MSEPQELAKLRDIHLPDPISWWPMAAGWYFLIFLALAVFALSYYFMRSAHRNGRAKRQALELLQSYEHESKHNANSQIISMKISELLRRVALVYFPRKEVARLEGEAWLAFLTSTSEGIDFKAIREHLLALPYQPAKEVDLQPLFSSARQWIKQRGKPCLN